MDENVTFTVGKVAIPLHDKKYQPGETVQVPKRLARAWVAMKRGTIGGSAPKAAAPAPQAEQPKPEHIHAEHVKAEEPEEEQEEEDTVESDEEEHDDMAKARKKPTGTYSTRNMRASDTSKTGAGKRKYQRRDMKSKK